MVVVDLALNISLMEIKSFKKFSLQNIFLFTTLNKILLLYWSLFICEKPMKHEKFSSIKLYFHQNSFKYFINNFFPVWKSLHKKYYFNAKLCHQNKIKYVFVLLVQFKITEKTRRTDHARNFHALLF